MSAQLRVSSSDPMGDGELGLLHVGASWLGAAGHSVN